MLSLPMARNKLAANGVLLAAILIHNLTYPLSAAGGPWPALFYGFYAVIFVAATWALTAAPIRRGAIDRGCSGFGR